MNVFIFRQGLISITLRDVVAIMGLPTIGCDVINQLKDIETLWTSTFNTTPSSYTHLFDDISTTKKLSIKEEHKYFILSFLGSSCLSFRC